MAILGFKYNTTSTGLDVLVVLQPLKLSVGTILTTWNHFNIKICAWEVSLNTTSLNTPIPIKSPSVSTTVAKYNALVMQACSLRVQVN